MNKITKAWTYGVAYLSLAVGSGVSISGNIADTYRVATLVARTPDSLDVAISAFWPAAVLLAIEMFVSRLWPRTGAMQAVRWAGSLGIGFVAMYVSWHHLSDLMSSRGQDGVVSSIGPLAIDGLAVMATGLILSSRGHKIVDTPPVATPTLLNTMTTKDAHTVANFYAAPVATAEQVDRLESGQVGTEETDMWRRLEAEMATVSTPAAPVSVSGPPALARSNEVKPESVPEGAAEWIKLWEQADEDTRPEAKVMYAWLADQTGRSARTIRRWHDAIRKSSI